MDEIERFASEVRENVGSLAKADDLRTLSYEWMQATEPYKYTYNFTWLGRPIIQLPADIIAMQELVWRIKPDLIVETGIAHGGSLIFYASMLQLVGQDGIVLGIDIDIRAHNRAEIEKHPMFHRIRMLEGSSVDPQVFEKVESLAGERPRVLVILDSNHTHDHVLAELRLYSKLVPKDSYIVVFDTVLEYVRDKNAAERPWGVGNNPLTAVRQFLTETDRFVVDQAVEGKLLLTVAPEGYLRCVRD
jgi:cephalosporin hydroxylase